MCTEMETNMGTLKNIDISQYNNIQPLSERVYVAIKSAILSGELSPGEQLLEVSVGKHFGVSRTPVRNALLRLEDEVFIEAIPRKGLVVRNIRAIDGYYIYDLAIALETRSTFLAANNRNKMQLDKIKHYCEKIEAIDVSENMHIADIEYRKLNLEFHVAIAEASDNHYLINSIKDVREKLLMFNTLQYNLDTESQFIRELTDNLVSHRNIYNAIVLQDGELASMLMEKHLSYSQKNFNQITNDYTNAQPSELET